MAQCIALRETSGRGLNKHMCAMDEYRNEYRMHVEEKMSAKKVSWARITKGILCLTRITNIPIPKVQKKPGRLNNRMKWRAPGD